MACAIVLQRTGIAAEIAEIDEGACRADLSPRQQCDDLDMGGMPELVDRRYRLQPIAAIDEHARVAREGRRIAGDADQYRRLGGGKCFRLLRGTGARWMGVSRTGRFTSAANTPSAIAMYQTMS